MSVGDHAMKLRVLVLCGGVALAGVALPAVADDEVALTPLESPLQLDATLELGVLRGRAREFVFDPDAGGVRVSRLDWDLDNVAMLRAGLAWHPRPWLSFHVQGATNRSNSAHLSDYDFNVDDCPPAAGGGSLCISTHPQTQLTRALEVNAGLDLRLVHHRLGDVSALFAYQWQAYDWRAYGGDSNYAGPLTPGAGITYAQRWYTPTLGLRWWRRFGAFDASLEGRGSAWARATDRDHHHLRGLLFDESFRSVDMFALAAELGYQFREGVRLSLRYDFQRWTLARGDTRLIDFNAGVEDSFAGAAGVSLYTQSVGLGVTVNLDRALVDDNAPPADPWRGGYGGFVVGPYWGQAAWHTRALGLPPLALIEDTRDVDFDSRAAYGGAFIGRSLRYRSWLLGVEADFGRVDADSYASGIPGSDIAEQLRASPDVLVVGTRWDASVRARVGRNLEANTLAYVTAGVAAQYQRYRVSCLLDGSWCLDDREAKYNTSQLGWTLGVGFETLFARGWFARVEYRYTDIGSFDHAFFSATASDRVATRLRASSHRLLFGVGLRF
jgi:omptin